MLANQRIERIPATAERGKLGAQSIADGVLRLLFRLLEISARSDSISPSSRFKASSHRLECQRRLTALRAE